MSFKTLDLAHDVASLVSSINEVVSISSSIYANDLNVKYFRNIASASAGADLGGYFQSAYDSSTTSALSTALFDLSYGYHTSSIYNAPATATSSQNEKIKMYRTMASLLLGDPNAQFLINGSSQPECFFIMLKRSLQKDEIKKGATQIILQVSASTGWSQVSASDDGATTNFKQTVGGDFAPLKYFGTGSELAQVWYQAGVIVVPDNTIWSANQPWSGSVTLGNCQYSGTINSLVDGLRHGTNGSTPAVDRINFHNQTNLYSTIYFCRAENSEFNYSSNPTFVDDNKRIRVTSGSNILQTRTYVTTIGLYDANDNLLAVSKVNKPITKSPDTEATFRIRLDY